MKDREQAGFEASGFEAIGFEAAEFDAGLADAMQRVDAPQTLESFLMLAVETEAQRRKAGDDRQVNLATQASLTQASLTQALPSSRGRLLAMASPQNWWAGAAAAMLVMGGTLGGLHVQHERAQAQATAEFELSERITDQALEQTRQQLQQAGISLGQ
jgi:hypothetical protein